MKKKKKKEDKLDTRVRKGAGVVIYFYFSLDASRKGMEIKEPFTICNTELSNSINYLIYKESRQIY